MKGNSFLVWVSGSELMQDGGLNRIYCSRTCLLGYTYLYPAISMQSVTEFTY